jgi:hypothetical protein
MPEVKPFNNCPALDGYHCQTNSLAKIYHFFNHSISEDMLLGLGAGMGYIYWKMKTGDEDSVFIGGRGNNKNFFQDVGKRTGVTITVKSTTSLRKAQTTLLDSMKAEQPVMLFGDMGFLPWFDFPEEYHFGGHTFTVCGWDGAESLLAADMDPAASGLKSGFYYPLTLEQLSLARSSPFKPFPPKNQYLEFDFSNFRPPTQKDIDAAIRQTVQAQLEPPIKNMGVKGLRHTAREILKWPHYFDDFNLRMNLYNIYIYVEIGGTGGGSFRYMYARFLKEAAQIAGKAQLNDIANKINQSGSMLSEIADLFKDAQHMRGIQANIEAASDKFNAVADLEEEAFSLCSQLRL